MTDMTMMVSAEDDSNHNKATTTTTNGIKKTRKNDDDNDNGHDQQSSSSSGCERSEMMASSSSSSSLSLSYPPGTCTTQAQASIPTRIVVVAAAAADAATAPRVFRPFRLSTFRKTTASNDAVTTAAAAAAAAADNAAAADEEEDTVELCAASESNSKSNNSTSLSKHHDLVVELALDEAERHLFDILVQAAAAVEHERQVERQCNSNSNHKNKNKNDSQEYERLEVRVAGGWVRDKLLGLQTHDVDIAVNAGLSGVQFATAVQQYLQKQQQEQNSNDNHTTTNTNTAVGRLAVIAANPAQSKHLETATMKVAGIDVDFCNLRSQEVYLEHSRIPAVLPGTPVQDALRRDFTINALFYNLMTKQVEDWTGRGLDDLQRGCLVTPLDPVQTFTDDPLRVLRAIRFAVRYQYTLDPTLTAACQLPDIHHALHVKVSRERVGKELEGMLSGKPGHLLQPNPLQALQTISQLKLAGSVFCIPQLVGPDKVAALHGHVLGHAVTVTSPNDDDTPVIRMARQAGWEEAAVLLTLLLPILNAHDRLVAATTATTPATATTITTATTFSNELPQAQSSKSKKKKDNNNKANNNATTTRQSRTVVDRRLLPVAVYLLPFRTLFYEEERKTLPPQQNVKQVQEAAAAAAKPKLLPVATYMFRHGIKFKNKDVQAMTILQETVQEWVTFLKNIAMDRQDDCNNNDSNDTLDVDVCRLEAGMLLRKCKDLWVSSLLLATVLLVREQQQQRMLMQSNNESENFLLQTVQTTKASSSTNAVTSMDWIELSQQVYTKIIQLDLDQCWNVKPLMDGKAVIDALGLPRAGPVVGTYLQEQMKWMLLNPAGSKEECKLHLLSVKRHLHEQEEEHNESHRGMSDGTGLTPSSPILHSNLRKTMTTTPTTTTSNSTIPKENGSDNHHDSSAKSNNDDDDDGMIDSKQDDFNEPQSQQQQQQDDEHSGESRHFSKKMHVESMDTT